MTHTYDVPIPRQGTQNLLITPGTLHPGPRRWGASAWLIAAIANATDATTATARVAPDEGRHVLSWVVPPAQLKAACRRVTSAAATAAPATLVRPREYYRSGLQLQLEMEVGQERTVVRLVCRLAMRQARPRLHPLTPPSSSSSSSGSGAPGSAARAARREQEQEE